MEIYNELSTYYSERPESILSENISFRGINDAIKLTFDYYMQNKQWDKELENLKSVPIKKEYMIGFKEERQRALDSFKKNITKIASEFFEKERSFESFLDTLDPRFFNKEYTAENLIEANLKVNGSTLPLEVILNKYITNAKTLTETIGEKEAKELISGMDQVIYLKRFGKQANKRRLK